MTFTTAIETLEYLEKNSTNCPSGEFNTHMDGGDETITEIDEYTLYINKYVTQKVLLNALIYTVAFDLEWSIFDNPSPSLDFSTNYVHASYQDGENGNFRNNYANLNKFNSFEDFSIVYTGDFVDQPRYLSTKNNSATFIDIIRTGEDARPVFLWELDAIWLALSPFDFTNITYILE